MNCDYQICVPQKISCGFLASFIFWISIIAVAVVSIVSGSAIFFGLERVDFPYDPSQIGLQFSWFLLLVIGLLVPIVIVDMYGSKNQRNCAGFALVIALVLVTASSVSFEISVFILSIFSFNCFKLVAPIILLVTNGLLFTKANAKVVRLIPMFLATSKYCLVASVD